MTLAPRFLISFWAGVLAARQTRRLQKLGDGRAAQDAVFRRLVTRLAATEYGRAAGLDARMTPERFRERVPPVAAAQLRPYVDRMAAGETDLLWPGACAFYVETAGTTGEPRRLPVTGEMLQHFRAGLRHAVLSYAARVGHAGVFLGRHLHVGASTDLVEQHGAWVASLDGILALALSPWAEANLYAPRPATARLPESIEKYRAIARETLATDVTLVGGSPAAVLSTIDSVRLAASSGKQRVTTLQAVWPNLECYLHTGAPLGLFTDELRASLGPDVRIHEVYAAAEGFIAVQDDDGAAGLRLLVDAGIYFEFLPAADYAPAQLARLGPKLLPLSAVQTGIDYIVFVTTPAGLCRCPLGDTVRFDSLQPPRLSFHGRTDLQLDTTGERVGGRDLTESLRAVCAANGWEPVNFHVAPYHGRTAGGLSRPCHEWWIELRPLTVKTPTGPVLAPLLDATLAARSPTYAARRQSGVLEAPVVRLVIPGVFDEWARGRKFGTSPSKMPRCRPDRSIADQLAALTRFHTSTQAPFAGATRPVGAGSNAPTAIIDDGSSGDSTNPLGISRERFR